MKRRSLEVTILSANNLSSKVGFLSKMKPYVIVSLDDPASSLQQQTTPVDKTGNENPRWDFPLKFTLNEATLPSKSGTLRLQVFSRRTILPDILIGHVRVPALNLLSNVEKSPSYQITSKRSGKPKGVVNFSYKFGDIIPEKPKQQVVRPKQQGRSNNGMETETGLLNTALAGLVVGDLASDICHHATAGGGGHHAATAGGGHHAAGGQHAGGRGHHGASAGGGGHHATSAGGGHHVASAGGGHHAGGGYDMCHHH